MDIETARGPQAPDDVFQLNEYNTPRIEAKQKMVMKTDT